MEDLIKEANKIGETDKANYAVVGGAGKCVKTSLDLLIGAISSIRGLTLTDIQTCTLYEDGNGYTARFKIEEYPGWLFGAWTIDKPSNEDVIIYLFGSPTELFNSINGRQFTPWLASFCASMSIEREELCVSLHNSFVINKFIDYLKVIKNSGIFMDWIFNKRTIIEWNKWDSAHNHGIFWYSIKNYFKKVFSWRKKSVCRTSKELLLD